ncbi:AraC family transcriptional regulator [Silvibacterium sp.]|uniref:AraC family transcriptional regulator n=1 Tax=Silvibacterium sp. TaxID=1964179 RepID=UPI0039E56C47
MDLIEQNRLRMVDLLAQLAQLEGMRPAPVEGVRLMRVNCSSCRVPVMYEPSIIIIARGRKRGFLHDKVFHYDARNYLTLTVPMPFECDTEVSEDGPFLGIGVRIDLAVVNEILMRMEPPARPSLVVAPEHTVSATPMDAELSGAAVRLLECMLHPLDASVLGPQIVREITYRVLRGRQGGALQSLLLMDSSRLQLHRILHRMHSDYAETLEVPELAQEAGMSISALHHHFKAMTGTSPLQYLKAVRLHKARMMMVQDSLSAVTASERVGYQSASQFSREFKRLFGSSPVEEVQRMRDALHENLRPAAMAG